MSINGWGFAALLTVLFVPSLAFAQEPTDTVDDTAIRWAYGTVVDSITVTGNKDTRDFVILREMETRPGDVLAERIIRRDIRFITDLSPFATVEVRADSTTPGHSALRIHVTERPGLLIKSILPIVQYDFVTGINYGVRWTDKNFRGRLENLNFQYTRNERDDDRATFSWFTPWIGWRHIGLGAGVAYFNRGDNSDEEVLLEAVSYFTFLSLPLTDSRIRFANLQTTFAVNKTRTGALGQSSDNETIFQPSIGYVFDSRDSGLRPRHGGRFQLTLFNNFPIEGARAPYYRVINDLRLFHPLRPQWVLAGYSNFNYQFGDFPDYSIIRLGGSGTLRGVPNGRWEGFHRWIQTVELRYLFIPKRVFWVPFFKYIDYGLGSVLFADGGIVWQDQGSFSWNNYHGSVGLGLRIYSPIRDVVRLDWGFNVHGEQRFTLAMGPRF